MNDVAEARGLIARQGEVAKSVRHPTNLAMITATIGGFLTKTACRPTTLLLAKGAKTPIVFRPPDLAAIEVVEATSLGLLLLEVVANSLNPLHQGRRRIPTTAA